MRKVIVRMGNLASMGLLVGILMAGWPLPARAGLGANAKSIEADALAMQGEISPPAPQTQVQSAAYRVTSFVTARGVTVNEYVSQSGVVFGVAWRGRRPPDLSILLGSYFSEYSDESARHKSLRRAQIATADLVVFLGGRMGHVVGRAYVPSLAPSGLDLEEVVK